MGEATSRASVPIGEGDPKPYQRALSPSFADSYASLHHAAHKRTESLLDLLQYFPYIGKNYDPPYEHAAPPLPCRRAVVPKTHCCLYYVVDEERRMLYFLRLGDTRQDPNTPWTPQVNGEEPPMNR